MTNSRRKIHGSTDRRLRNRRKTKEFYEKEERRQRHDRRAASHRRTKPDRRRYMRFPVSTNVMRPVEFTLEPSEVKGTIPGIITQLSPGGLSMLSFAPIKVGMTLFLTVNLPHLKINMIKGQVVRVEEKGETYLAGIHFSHIQPDDRSKLNVMALDYADCELKISFGIKDVCFKDCAFYPLCEKPQKI